MPSLKAVDKERQLTAVGSFIFAGGFTLGMREAGFEILAHLEDGPFGVATARLNFSSIPIHTEPESWPLDQLEDVDVVYANPPCSPWSTAGIVRGQTFEQQTDWKSHPSSGCMTLAFSLLSRIRPKIWCVESVRQLYSKGKTAVDDMAKDAMNLGYDVHELFVEAKNHNVPQHRKRYFMVCSRVKIDWKMPKWNSPTVYRALSNTDQRDDMIGGTPKSIEGIIRLIKQGENARMVWDREVAAGRQPSSSRPAFIYDRMAGDRVSYTLLGSCNKIHPDEDRMLSVNESKAICGFPCSFRFVGSMGDRYAQIGKGVCPPVARWLGENLAAAIDQGRPVVKPQRTVTEVKQTI